MAAPVLLLASILVLLLGAGLAIGLRTNRWRARAAIATQAVASAMVLVAIAPVLGGGPQLEVLWPWPAPIHGIAFRVDGLGAFFLAWSLPMTLGGTIYATGYLRAALAKGRNGGPHFALLNVTSIAFVLIYSVQNALVYLLAWEIAAVAAWLLVIWDYRSQKIRFAGFNYLVSTHVGLFVLVSAFMLLHSRTDSMDFADFGAYLTAHPELLSTIALLGGIAFALKSAFFPFHTWLPRAHAAAPAHVSALMSGVIHKAGLFGFLRFCLLGPTPAEWLGWCVLAFGAASASFGVLYTAVQRDLKRLLGYSSTENVGVAAMAFGVGLLGWSWHAPTLVVLGFGAGLFHIVSHALFKCALFYAAGAVHRATHTVDLERLGGLARPLPRTAALFAAAGLAMAGLPPFGAFLGEFALFSGLLSGAAPTREADIVFVGAAALLAFVGAVSALAMVRAFGLLFLGAPRDAAIAEALASAGATDRSWAMQLPVLVHVAAIAAIGVAPSLVLVLVEPALAAFVAHGGGAAATLAPHLSAAARASGALTVAIAAVALVAWRRRGSVRRGPTWGCGYGAISPRMQYTGSSFSALLSSLFRPVLPLLTRERLPQGPFPQQAGHVSTHHVDAVERRLYEVLGQGEQFVRDTSDRIPEEPRFAFAAGLVAVVVLALIALGAVLR